MEKRHKVVHVDWKDDSICNVIIKCEYFAREFMLIHYDLSSDSPVRCPYCEAKLRLYPMRTVEVEEV